MKNKLFILSAVSILSLYSFEAKAKVYFGGGYQLTNLNFVSQDVKSIEPSKVATPLNYEDYFEKNLDNFNIFTGIKINKSQAFELGYYYNNSSKVNNNPSKYVYDATTAKSNSKLQILSLDMITNNPIVDDMVDLNLIIGASMVNYQNKIDLYKNDKFSQSRNVDQNKLGLNLGVGTEAFVTKRISLRTQIKIVLIPTADVVNRVIIGNIGIKIKI